MEEGWLIRDGEVLASLVARRGWRGRIVSTKEFDGGVGAVEVTGPAVVLGAAVARLRDSSHLHSLSTRTPVHVIGPGRHAVAVVPNVASSLHKGDDLQIRRAS